MRNTSGAYGPHGCTSNAYGRCTACNAFAINGGAVALMGRTRATVVESYQPNAFTLELRRFSNRAKRATIREAKREARETQEALKALASIAALSRKCEARKATARCEAYRAAEGAERRAERAAEIAAKAQKVQTAAQAVRIALRGSQAREWIVAIRFARGAHDVVIAKVDAVPAGYRESRASAQTRGNVPALRWHEAETVQAGIVRKLPKGRRSDGRRRRG